MKFSSKKEKERNLCYIGKSVEIPEKNYWRNFGADVMFSRIFFDQDTKIE